jgi:hypothetical protein
METKELINMTDKYQTRDGKDVVVLAVGLKSYTTATVCAKFINSHDGFEEIMELDSYGNYLDGKESNHDLIKVKPRIKKTVWLNIHSPSEVVYSYEDRDTADINASRYRIACVKVEIDCEEGEGI